MNQVQALLQRINANHNSTAPASMPFISLQITIAVVLFCTNMLNFLITDSGLKWLFLSVAALFVGVFVMNIVMLARLKHGFVFAPEGLSYRGTTPIPWAYLTGASVHPKRSGFYGRDVMLYVTPQGMQWVHQHRKGFLRPSKFGHGVEASLIRPLSPEESAYVLNETIRLYRHRHGLPV